MVDLPNKEIKIFWENKILALLIREAVPNDDENKSWFSEKLVELQKENTWQEIEECATNICFAVYAKSSTNDNPTPTNFAELMAGLPSNDDGKTALEEYHEIRQKTMMDYEADLINTSEETDFIQRVLERLLKDILKYQPNKADYHKDNPKLAFRHFKKNILKNRSLGKILKKERRNEKLIHALFLANEQIETSLKTILGLGNNVLLPNDWTTKLVKKSDLDTANAQITTLTTDRDNQKNRADTLQTWKDSHSCSALSCSHTDYDTIKQERDQLKTDKESHNCDSKVQAKETQIISKIITDLGLSTERERENVLEAVIAEIKTKITPPANNTDKNRISELEAEVINLKKPAPEVVTKMTEFSQELDIANTEYQEKLSQAESYQQLVSIQSKAFKEKLTSEVASKNSAERLNIGLGALSIGSLLLLFWMLVKRTDFLPEKEKK